MLQLTNGSIVELNTAQNALGQTTSGQNLNSVASNQSCGIGGGSSGGYWWGQQCYPYQTQWYSYPVYVTTDKTKKAIEILKTLEAEKKIRCDSVPKFIELVEKIAAIL